ncbi:hypothetical protein [Lyngbya confervoides]|uniref:GGDEF domain-containing protein n=1 Tax=Lyngbya confervoides BDU141951 TaxID=1574623 RepID=A0ABD4T754_9CYAN|nr:hypothetical protein [Lyngbya confervoides]MCM1984572.1 hypothetical protein [Lyngbya confervoides BDU141951]
MTFPAELLQILAAWCAQNALAYFQVTEQGEILSWGTGSAPLPQGLLWPQNPHWLEPPSPSESGWIGDWVEALQPLFPLEPPYDPIKWVQLTPDRVVDVVFFPGTVAHWVILLDSQAEFEQQQRWSQARNELRLLQQQQQRILQSLGKSWPWLGAPRLDRSLADLLQRFSLRLSGSQAFSLLHLKFFSQADSAQTHNLLARSIADHQLLAILHRALDEGGSLVGLDSHGVWALFLAFTSLPHPLVQAMGYLKAVQRALDDEPTLGPWAMGGTLLGAATAPLEQNHVLETLWQALSPVFERSLEISLRIKKGWLFIDADSLALLNQNKVNLESFFLNLKTLD